MPLCSCGRLLGESACLGPDRAGPLPPLSLQAGRVNPPAPCRQLWVLYPKGSRGLVILSGGRGVSSSPQGLHSPRGVWEAAGLFHERSEQKGF